MAFLLGHVHVKHSKAKVLSFKISRSITDLNLARLPQSIFVRQCEIHNTEICSGRGNTYSEPNQTFNTELFAKIFISFQLLTIFSKASS